jgi:hypothetical protein
MKKITLFITIILLVQINFKLTSAGELNSLWDRYDNANIIVEVQFRVTITEKEKRKFLKIKSINFKQNWIKSIMNSGKIVDVLKSKNNDLTPFTLPTNLIILPSSKCWKNILRLQTFKAIYFFDNKIMPIIGVEQGRGHYLSINPNYDKLIQAIKITSDRIKGNNNELLKKEFEGHNDIQSDKIIPKETSNLYLKYLTINYFKKYKKELNVPFIDIEDPTIKQINC